MRGYRLRRLWAEDEGAALLMSLMVIILASTLSLAVAGSILAQVKPTQVGRKLASAISAAEAGLDVAQKIIHKAESGSPVVLPCGPFADGVGGSDASTYVVTVQYYKKDPTGRPDGWLKQSAHHLDCPPGGLTPTGDWWALLTSVGSGPPVPGTRVNAGDRTLTAVLAPAGVPAPAARGFIAGSSGDGWEPIFLGENVYNVFHHYGEYGMRNGAMIDCHSKITGIRCAGYSDGVTAGTYASSVAGTPFGTGVDNLMTPSFAEAAIDRPNNRIYVAGGVLGTYDVGVICLDVAAKESCGFTKLATSPNLNADDHTPDITGGAQIGTQYYVLGPQAKIYCFDYATATKECSGFPAGGITATTITGAPDGWAHRSNLKYSSLKSFGDGYLFGTVGNSTEVNTKDLICIDTENNWQSCASFPQFNASDYPGMANNTLAPYLSGTGDVIGICAFRGDFGYTDSTCYRISDGAVLTSPFGPYTEATSHYLWDGVLRVGTRVYLALSTGPATTPRDLVRYTCYDFATNSTCPGFPTTSSGVSVGAYTLRQDPYEPTCIWEAGDYGVFEVFNHDTGVLGTC